MFKTMIGTFALAVALSASPAAAAPAVDTATRTVRIDDLNLATPYGLAVLDRRVDAAARSVCKISGARTAALGERAEPRSCIIAAKTAAARRIAAVTTQHARGG